MRARVAFLLAVWSGAAGLARAAETWIEVKTANFTVVSNAGEGTAQRTAREFEQVRAAYAKVWPWAHLAQGRPTVVLALKNEGTLRRWAPSYYEAKGGIDVASGSAVGADRQYLLVRTDYRPDNVGVTPNFNLYRAYLTVLISGSFERRLPLWLSNGLAEVLGNTSVRDKDILVGQPVPWEFRRFNEGSRLPLRTILDARAESALLTKEDDRAQFDAQTYVLVHYLLYGDRGAHAPALNRFLQLWLAGRSQDQALVEAFGDLAALEAALPSYATRQILSFARLHADATIAGERPAARVLAPAEVAGLQATVHLAMNRPVDAQAAIREARTADPRSPLSYDAEGLLADRDRDKVRATEAYARAVELGSTSAYSHYRAAQLAWKPQLDAAALAGLRQRLERSIELNGSYANAQSFLAEVLVQQGDGQAALAPAERAVALEPGDAYHRVALARVLHKLGRVDEARKSAELGLQLADDDAERSNAERFLMFLNEEARYAQDRARQEASWKQTNACEGGDAAACAQILPAQERACREGAARACLYLSWLYTQGTGLPKDAAKAAGYVGQACAVGDKRACVEHAWRRVGGDGVAKDEPGGLAALGKLCDESFFPACTRLAIAQASKPGAAARGRAKALLARACEGGEADACEMARRFK
jgi:Flp pilus assembly protein TadD